MKKAFVRIVAVLLCVVLSLGFNIGTYAKSDPTVFVDSVTAMPGDTVDVKISLKNNPGIGSFKMKVAFPDDLTLNKVTYNIASLNGQTMQPQSILSPVTLNWISPLADVDVDCVYATLNFTVANDSEIGDKDITVTYNQSDVYDIDENDVQFAVENGKISVIGCMHENTTFYPAVSSTCEQGGHPAYTKCDDCGMIIEGDVTVFPALGHNYTEVVTEPTFTSDGYTTHTCTRCGNSYIDNIVPAYNEATTPTIVVDSVTTMPGNIVDVKISLENNPGICTLYIKVAYDSALTLVDATDSNLLIGAVFGNDKTKNPYFLTWDDSLGEYDNTENGTIVTLKFRVDEQATEGDKSITVTYDSDEIYNLNLDAIPFAIKNGKITVTNVFRGDVDGNGKINMLDVTYLRRYLAGGYGVTINEANADVDGNGKINALDVTILRRYIAGGYGIVLN